MTSGSGWLDRRPAEWTSNAFDELAGEVEGWRLEFKKGSEFKDRTGSFSRDVMVREICETVSAFLNSDGGWLLIGVGTVAVSEDPKREVLQAPAEWSPGHTLPGNDIDLPASRVQDIILSNLSPRPQGVESQMITVETGSGPVPAIVVRVAPTDVGAHQSLKESRYYRRLDDQDVPMSDWERRDVDARRSSPQLNLYVAVSGMDPNPGLTDALDVEWVDRPKRSQAIALPSPDGGSPRFIIWLFMENAGRRTASSARLELGIPPSFRNRGHPPTHEGGRLFRDRGVDDVTGKKILVGVSQLPGGDLPDELRSPSEYSLEVDWYVRSTSDEEQLWGIPGRLVRVDNAMLLRPSPPAEEQAFIPWRIYSEDTTPTQGVARLILKSTSESPATPEGSRLVSVRNDPVELIDWAPSNDTRGIAELRQKMGSEL